MSKLAFALALVGVMVIAGYLYGQQEDIRTAANDAKHVAAVQAQLRENLRDQLLAGCQRGELARQEVNARGAVQRQLWARAAQAWADAGQAATAAYYRARIKLMRDVPVLIPGGYLLPKAKLDTRVRAACAHAYNEQAAT